MISNQLPGLAVRQAEEQDAIYYSRVQQGKLQYESANMDFLFTLLLLL